MTGYQEEILSVTVPLADQETTGTVSTDDMEMTLSMPTQIWAKQMGGEMIIVALYFIEIQFWLYVGGRN